MKKRERENKYSKRINAVSAARTVYGGAALCRAAGIPEQVFTRARRLYMEARILSVPPRWTYYVRVSTAWFLNRGTATGKKDEFGRREPQGCGPARAIRPHEIELPGPINRRCLRCGRGIMAPPRDSSALINYSCCFECLSRASKRLEPRLLESPLRVNITRVQVSGFC